MSDGAGYGESHVLVLTKLAERQLREQVITKNISVLLNSVNNRALELQGWSVTAIAQDIQGNAWQQFDLNGDAVGNERYRYEMYIGVNFWRGDARKPDPSVFRGICRKVFTASAQPVNGRWTLSKVDDAEYVPPDESGDMPLHDHVGYTDVRLPADWPKYFNHLYGLDYHHRRIKRALEAGLMSNWMHRFNCVLIGPPGCGKSDMCQSIKRAVGDEACLEFDATATTAAGAIKELADRDILPRVLIVEEIEKADEKALSFLLSVLDLRSEIRKTTARATIQRDTKLFGIATVNNKELFNKLQAGALASRFSNKIYFKRPNRDQLSMILHREVAKVDGDFAWIDPCLDWCEGKHITDPRQVTAICLCGREELVTGEYQQMLEETSDSDGITDDGLLADWSS